MSVKEDRRKRTVRRTKKTAAIGKRDLAKLPGATPAKLPTKFTPQLAVLADKVPAGDDWLHEMKFDGYRLLAFVDHGKVRLVTRNGNDWTDRFRAIEQALESLPADTAILDGEVVSLNKEGLSDFQELQNLLKRGNEKSLVYYIFDAPYLGGYDLTQTPLVARKEALAKLVLRASPKNDGLLRYSDHIRGEGESVLASACQHTMEGIVSKRADSTYQQYRSPSWLKIKCLKRQEFVIGGFTKPSGSRVGFGSLLVGYYESNRLVYAGRVGTGFTHDTLRQLTAELKRRRTDTSPFDRPPTGAIVRGVTWVRPELVGEVEFTEWTEDGLLRHPSFQGLREDKPPQQIIREKPKVVSKRRRRLAKAGSIRKRR
jgi:bifunctional non-homologous end joining protein LigD